MNEEAAKELTEWWLDVASEDAAKTIPKAIEYGSRGEDMVEIGRHLATIADLYPPFVDQDCRDEIEPDEFYAMLGCHFYLVGKLARAAEAYRQGQVPKDDTLLDIRVYAFMEHRIKEVGHWGA